MMEVYRERPTAGEAETSLTPQSAWVIKARRKVQGALYS